MSPATNVCRDYLNGGFNNECLCSLRTCATCNSCPPCPDDYYGEPQACLVNTITIAHTGISCQVGRCVRVAYGGAPDADK